jgi:hypothetical protein
VVGWEVLSGTRLLLASTACITPFRAAPTSSSALVPLSPSLPCPLLPLLFLVDAPFVPCGPRLVRVPCCLVLRALVFIPVFSCCFSLYFSVVFVVLCLVGKKLWLSSVVGLVGISYGARLSVRL